MFNYDQVVGVIGYNSSDAYNDAKGVHWFWWVFWLIFFAPMLAVVGYVHHQRMKRAIIFYGNNYNGLPPYDGL